MNICWKCKNWSKCMKYRYENIQLEYMVEVNRCRDNNGKNVIYVSKCTEFKKEPQDKQVYVN